MARTEIEDVRSKRVPLGQLRSKLTVPDSLLETERFQHRWVCDRAGRVDSARDGGYTFVLDTSMKIEVGEGQNGRDKMSTAICRTVGTHPDGSAMKAYLMRIRKDWYEKDQREKEKKMDEIDAAIRGGEIASQPDDKRYVGSQGIQYKP